MGEEVAQHPAGGGYVFGEFRLNPAGGWLRRGAQEVELPPKGFQVLRYLIEHRDRLVPKQELLETLWKDTFVTDDALVQAIIAIRRALGDDAEQPRYIRTKPRVGYQFIAPLEAEGAAAEVSADVAPVGRGTARALLLAIQAGYLLLYSLLLFNLETAALMVAGRLTGGSAAGFSFYGLLVLALCGVAVRLYLIGSVALDHPATGRQFGRLFPFLLVFDLLSALAPLLLVEWFGRMLALALVPVLVYGPFSQRALIRSAYRTA